jgi:hypothetical protein
MANASKHHVGPGSQGKGAGVGGMTDLPDGLLGENDVLSNRDKSRHGDERGLDSKTVQVEQFQDTVANREVPAVDAGDAVGNTSGLGGPMSDTSSQKGTRQSD